jgi:hypothetical protein
MYAFLLLLGSIIAAAGLALVASGISVQQHTFDLGSVTPGTIAIIGGCILIGLAFVVRALLRVERALMARPISRPARADESVGAMAAAAQASDSNRIPFPPKPRIVASPQPGAVPTPVRAVPAETEAVQPLQPAIQERLESAPMVEESDVSLLPKPPVRVETVQADISHAVAGRTNGVARAKAGSANARAAAPPPQVQTKGSLFDSLWPKAQRVAAPLIQTEPAGLTAAPVPVPQQVQEPTPPPKPAAAPQPPAAAVSILKSGVVEGMAYTLYSDGSIEAQLPGGTLRFGSITELRNHIEQNG